MYVTTVLPGKLAFRVSPEKSGLIFHFQILHMSFVTNNYYYFFEEDATKEILSLLKQIRMTQEQLVTELANLQAQTEKAKTEVLAKIASWKMLFQQPVM